MEIRSDFEWDSAKDELNQRKHGVSFAMAQLAFLDSHRVILEDLEHCGTAVARRGFIVLAKSPKEL